jgi:hypothetical protein
MHRNPVKRASFINGRSKMLQLDSHQGVKIQPNYIKIIPINSIGLLHKFRESVQPSRPKIATTPIKFGVFCYERWTVFLRNRGLFRHDSIFKYDTWEKTERGYCRWACSGQKPPSVSQNSSPAGRGSSCKIGTETENGKSGKIGLEDAFDLLCS